MDLTIGILEDKLRKFPKETTLTVECGCCHHGSLGAESIIGVSDKTNQSYGYVELSLNDSCQSEVELSSDKEEFYKAEVEKLNKIIEGQRDEIKKYEYFVKSVEGDIKWVKR